MRDLIDRMMRCGIPEITAMCVASEFEKRDKLNALAAYVLVVEGEYGR